MNGIVNGAPRAAWPGHQLLEGVGVVAKDDRGNLIKVTTGLAMAGGGVYALMNVPGTKPVQKAALATLGGGLLVSAILTVYDAFA
jgi:hypothetical protein